MKHLSQDKYTIAWFKLAECVSRGEKERAFGVYRLLAHSIDNHAFACQLQGDLYFSFDDIDAAIAKYFDAAHMYEAEDRFLEAAAVYENLLGLRPAVKQYRERIISLYQRLHIPTKVLDHRICLIEQCMDEHKYKIAHAELALLDVEVDPSRVAQAYEHFICRAYESGELSLELLEKTVAQLMEIYLSNELNKQMRLFIAKLQGIDGKLHATAMKCLKD